MSAPAFVYWPDDEPESLQVGGDDHKLLPNRTTEIRAFEKDTAVREALEKQGYLVAPDPHLTPDTTADIIANRLGMWGLRKTKGPVENGKATLPEDQAIVDEAERVYVESHYRWATDLLVKDAERRKPIEDAGLPVTSDPVAVKARAWLAAYAGKLKEYGIAS